jgi:hypothetical protein
MVFTDYHWTNTEESGVWYSRNAQLETRTGQLLALPEQINAVTGQQLQRDFHSVTGILFEAPVVSWIDLQALDGQKSVFDQMLQVHWGLSIDVVQAKSC